MKNIWMVVLCWVVCVGCDKVTFFDGPDHYEDSFESYTSLGDMLQPDDPLWSFTQITESGNAITVDTANVHSGKKSLKFVAVKSPEDDVSKCSIAKHNMAYWEGETVRVSGWYYIEGTKALDWLFLFDLEEQTAIGAGPGMRLALVNNQLRVEYKFLEKDILQSAGQEVDFPRDQWVEIVWEVKLSQSHEGTVKLWQNRKLIIDTQNNVTLPSDILYFLQGTKGMYSSIEIGVTANSKDNDITLWMDDITFEKVD